VFLLAAFPASALRLPPARAPWLGCLVAVAIGWGIDRGGVRLDLRASFRVTAAVLVPVSRGLVATALSHRARAAWLNGLQTQAFASRGSCAGTVDELSP